MDDGSRIGSYGPTSADYDIGGVADVQTPVSPPASSTPAAAESGPQETSTPTFANLPKPPLSDPMAASVFMAKFTNMDGTDRTCPGVNVCVNFQGSPEFQALPEATRNKILQEAANDPSVEDRLNQLYERPLYKNMTTQQRTELLNVFAGANNEGRQELITLMGRHLPSGESALLSKDLKGGNTLLDNLNQLANQSLAPGLERRRSEILSQVIDDSAEPTWYMDQGNVNTCAPTSLQTGLLVNSPAEYARLIGGLMGPNRQATLANGDTMSPALNDLATPPTVTPSGTNTPIADTRSITERVFQSALAQYSYIQAGRSMPIVNASADIPGLYPNEIAKAQSGLYGRDYKVADTNTPLGAAGVYAQVATELSKGHGPVPVGLKWDTGGHRILVDHIAVDSKGNAKVYIRNPWGSSDAQGKTYKDGQVLGTAGNNTPAGPLRTVADSQSGLEAMDLKDFMNAVTNATVEK